MTFCKEGFTKNANDSILLKGAIIDKYLLRKEMSQGEIVYINENKLSQIKNINKNLYGRERIVLQGITGINEKNRLKMMIIKNAYCANSLNYLTIKRNIDKKYLLGLLNSKLINFVFSKFSTNSNVNGYEVDNLPMPNINQPSEQIIKHVNSIILAKELDSMADTTFFENQIDIMVYKLYNLTYNEVKIVDPEFSLSEAEYEVFEIEQEANK